MWWEDRETRERPFSLHRWRPGASQGHAVPVLLDGSTSGAPVKRVTEAVGAARADTSEWCGIQLRTREMICQNGPNGLAPPCDRGARPSNRDAGSGGHRRLGRLAARQVSEYPRRRASPQQLPQANVEPARRQGIVIHVVACRMSMLPPDPPTLPVPSLLVTLTPRQTAVLPPPLPPAGGELCRLQPAVLNTSAWAGKRVLVRNACVLATPPREIRPPRAGEMGHASQRWVP